MAEMDWRDLEFWAAEAAKAEVQKEMAMLRTVRLAVWAEKDQFVEVYDMLTGRLFEIEGTSVDKVEANWSALREIGGR